MTQYNNYQQYGGYPNGYPPQNFDQNEFYQQAVNSPYSPFFGEMAYQQPVQQQVIQNPYPSYDYGQQAQTQQPNMPYNPYASYQPQGNSFQPYMNQPQNPYYNQYNTGYGYGAYNAQYQYNQYIQEQLYSNNPECGFDPFECLRDAILSDEEKERARLYAPDSYSWNGSPIYTNRQLMIQREEQEKEIKRAKNFWMKLTKAAYCEDESVTDQMIEEAYFPPPKQMQQPAVYNMTPEQLQHMNDLSVVDNTAALHYQLIADDYNEIERNRQFTHAAAKIKESHDKVLGLKEEDYNLSNYLENASMLWINARTDEQRRRNRDGSIKYARSEYKRSLLPDYIKNDPNAPISMFTDDDFVPLEKRIKEQYLLKKMNNQTKFLSQLSGTIEADGSYTPSRPPSVDPETEMARAAFIDEATKGMKKW